MRVALPLLILLAALGLSCQPEDPAIACQRPIDGHWVAEGGSTGPTAPFVIRVNDVNDDEEVIVIVWEIKPADRRYFPATGNNSGHGFSQVGEGEWEKELVETTFDTFSYKIYFSTCRESLIWEALDEDGALLDFLVFRR